MSNSEIHSTSTATTTTRHIACRAPGCHLRGSVTRDGWCTRHHGLARTTGRSDWVGPAPTIARNQPVNDRFKAYTVATPGGCVLWAGGLTSAGYGIFAEGAAGLRWVLAHRWAYVQAHDGAEIPDGLVIDHVCRVRSCVNPKHLEVVTPAENTRRGFASRRAERELRAPALAA